jgi:prepilin-type N-terminal cleavage/methylation domain-containing protein/prepilin-type processing-associated H-X9-DG protein
MKHSLRRGAFSMVELLVVIAIIAILIALLIPAVQKVRASAANAQCVNNLKQIGQGLHGYHDVHRHFPAGDQNLYFGDPWLWTEGPWTRDILLYIEQDALERLFKQASDNWYAYVSRTNDYDSESASSRAVRDLAAIVVPTYICPADPRENAGSTPKFAHITYAGVKGKIATEIGDVVAGTAPDTRGTGVFPQLWISGPTRPVVTTLEITDGLSNTIMVGERPPADNRYEDINWWDRLFAIELDYGFDSRGANGGGKPCPALAYFSPGDLSNFCHSLHFWSLHSGGGNWLLCDGSVRFMQYSAGTTVIPDMATISGGEIIPPFE